MPRYRPFSIALFIVCTVFLLNTPSTADDETQRMNERSDFGDQSLDPKNYPTVPGIGFPKSPCNVDMEDLEGSPTRGKVMYSCRTTRLAHQRNGKIWKFLALACRNGSSPWIALHKASTQTRSMVFSQQLEAKGKFQDSSDFVMNREILNCVRQQDSVPTSPELTVTGPGPSPETNEPEPHPDTVIFKMRSEDRYKLSVRFFAQIEKGRAWPGSSSHYDLNRAATYTLKCAADEKICYGAWREGQDVSWGTGRDGDKGCKNCCAVCGDETDVSIGDGGPDAGPPPAIITMKNEDRYSLGLEFFSVNRGGSWPGGGKQYVLSGTHTYTLRCESGEKICFGAWRDHQTTTWGAGRDGKQGCTGCCLLCGQRDTKTLLDGGADRYPPPPQVSSAPPAQGGGGGSVPPYVPPSPPSTITGLDGGSSRTSRLAPPSFRPSSPGAPSRITGGIRSRGTPIPTRSSPRSRSTLTGFGRH